MFSVKNLNVKLNQRIKKPVIYIGVFLAMFAILFYLVNLNMKQNPQAQAATGISFAGVLAGGSIDKEIKSRLGSTEISVVNYESWAEHAGLSAENAKIDADPDLDKLPNYLEYIHDTDPLNADTDGDKYTDFDEIVNGYDPDSPGSARLAVDISISKMNISAPMVWSKSELEKDQLDDLKDGVSHFPKSASPGQKGNMIISGHSSNYIWAKGSYNHIFEKLNNLVPGDFVDVKVSQQNGRIIIYHYKVSGKLITVPNDARIFENSENKILTLSTCWPLGTNFKRLIVKAEMQN